MSGRWESDPLPSPWEGDILPVNYARNTAIIADFSKKFIKTTCHCAARGGPIYRVEFLIYFLDGSDADWPIYLLLQSQAIYNRCHMPV